MATNSKKTTKPVARKRTTVSSTRRKPASSGRFLSTSKLPNKRLGIIFAAFFAAAGVYLVYRLFAATAPIATVEAESLTLPAGAAIITDSTASSTKAINLTANGAATGSVILPAPATNLTVRAKGVQCNGAPQMVVKVDGAVVSTSSVSATSWTDYSAPVSLTAATHSISVEFTNDNTEYKKGNGRLLCSRDLYVDKLTLFGDDTATTATTVDDATVGTASNQFEFVGPWTVYQDAGSYNGSEHYSATSGAYYQVRFTGTQVKVYTTVDPNRGIAAVSIDGGSETMVDSYSSGHTNGVLSYTSPVLPASAHTLKVRVTGTKNPASSGVYVVADRVVVTSGSTPTPTPTPTPTNSAAAPTGIPGTWSLKFADDFDGTSLDLTKWRPNWLSSSDTTITQPVNDTEPLCFDPANVSVGSGLLTIKAEKRNCTASNGKTYPNASGLIESYHDYNFTYGVTEARIFLPAGADGTTPIDWPNFWTNGNNWPATGEDDIMEVLGGKTCFTYHYGEATAPKTLGSTCTAHKAGWHTFASNWQPNSVTYYYDGVQVGSYAVSVASPHYLIASLQLGSVINSINGIVPAQMQIDYVRVWQ